jgi:hypothetical protein
VAHLTVNVVVDFEEPVDDPERAHVAFGEAVNTLPFVLMLETHLDPTSVEVNQEKVENRMAGTTAA